MTDMEMSARLLSGNVCEYLDDYGSSGKNFQKKYLTQKRYNDEIK